jgi:hypothetical protein
MRQLLIIALLLLSEAAAVIVHAAEPIAGIPSATAATLNVAAVPMDQLEIHQYFYIDFPRQIQLLENAIELAEAERDLVARRVHSYRPFRSFGPYAATYLVDQSWQVALLAAEHRLECLRLEQADLWRQRRLIAEAVVAR